MIKVYSVKPKLPALSHELYEVSLDKREETHIILEGTNLDISDGYHTFNELYDHRCTLFIAFASTYKDGAYFWKSAKHADGSMMEGFFIAGLFVQHGKQIAYHMPVKFWELCPEARTLDVAPEWDKHTPDQALERLLKLISPDKTLERIIKLMKL